VDADFCSDCGSQIAAGSASAPASGTVADPDVGAVSASGEDCPKCSETRDGAAQFCGVCGYDFVNKTGGEVPPADPVVATPATTAATPVTPPLAVPAGNARIDVEVIVNGGRPRKHSLFDEESLIGRPNNKAVLSLTIDGDEGISRRQMMITRHADKVTVRDLDSANGTEVERDNVVTKVAAGEERELTAGDKIRIGEFTVVIISSINL
jgi:hypothetical protein